MKTNENRISRRKFLGITGGALAVTVVAAAGVTIANGEQRTIIHRFIGTTFTDLADASAWQATPDTLVIAQQEIPELAEPGSAIRVEGEALSDPILIVHGGDNAYYAFKNACTHAGRKIDPVAGTMTIECCSVSGSTYDYEGNVLSGPAEKPLTTYPVAVADGELHIQL